MSPSWKPTTRFQGRFPANRPAIALMILFVVSGWIAYVAMADGPTPPRTHTYRPSASEPTTTLATSVDEMAGGTPIGGAEARAFIAERAPAHPLPAGVTFGSIPVDAKSTPEAIEATMDFYGFCQWTIVAIASPTAQNAADQEAAPAQMTAAATREATFPPAASGSRLLASVARALRDGDHEAVTEFLEHNCGVGS